MPSHLRRLAGALSALLLLAASTAPGHAADAFTRDEQAAIVAIVEKGMVEQRQPGLAVGIWIPRRGEFVRAFGLRDIAARTPMRRADHVRIASITKTFVATAVLRLVEQGRLGLDDRLAAFVDDIPNGRAITVRNLLGMTSGV
jgi:D-alanyl-D-alanine carboxypeptidase